MTDHSIFSAAAWAAMGLGLGGPEPPEPEPEGTSIWPFVLLSIIIGLSTVFDCCKEMVEHTTPETFKPIVEAFFSELATLGFIGALAFLLTYNFSSSCEGACSIMQQVSEHFLGEPNELQEIFEKLHFLLFAVSVVFILVVLVLLRISLKNGHTWTAWEKDMKEASEAHKAAVAAYDSKLQDFQSRVSSLDDDIKIQHARELMLGNQEIKETESKLAASVIHVRGLMEDKEAPEGSWIQWILGRDPKSSLWFEWMKPSDQLQAEYYRIRHRFVDDEDEIVEAQMDPDFDFCHYLKLSLAHTFAEVIEIKPVDWLVLWLGFACVFVLYYVEPEWTLWSFLVVEVLILLLALLTQAKLVKIRYNLLPAVDHPSTMQASCHDFASVFLMGDDDDNHSETSPLIPARDNVSPQQPPPALKGSLRFDVPGLALDSITAGQGISREELMAGGPVAANLLGSPDPSPSHSPVPGVTNGPRAFTAQPPADVHAPKAPYRAEHHPETYHPELHPNPTAAGGGPTSAFMKSPRRGSGVIVSSPMRAVSSAAADVSPRTQTLVSISPVRRLSSDTGGAQSRALASLASVGVAGSRPGSTTGLESVSKGKMTAKTNIVLSRPRYTTLPTQASVKTGLHMSPARQPSSSGSRKNLAGLGASKRQMSGDAHNTSHGAEEEDRTCLGMVKAVLCCACFCSGHKPPIPTKHQALFWFGIRGKGFMIHMVKLLLFASVISLAVIAVELRIELIEQSLFLLFVAIVPPVLTLVMTPRNLQLLNLVTSIEIMKKEELIVDVIKQQRFEKQRKVMQILSSLQFFLDQAEALSADTTADGVPRKDVAYQFKKLRQDKQTKTHLDDLEELFNYYDDDNSGSIDIEELGMLLSQMGQHKTPDELDRLFNLMDADQSGTVEFDEFAVVIMANRKAKRNMNPEALADRLWKLFDSNGDGSIECLELSDTLKSLGQNWNTDDVDAFFKSIDKDGSGSIDKEEFVDFIRENLGGRQAKGHSHH